MEDKEKTNVNNVISDLEQIGKQIREAYNSQVKILNGIVNAQMKDFALQQAELAATAGKAVKEEIKKVIAPILEQGPIIAKQASLIAANVRELPNDMARAAAIMNTNGWWLINCMPITFFKAIPQYEAELTPEALTEIIVSYVNKDEARELTEIIDGWHLPSFESRTHIFQDALWAHKQGKFTLTVPTLTIQVEGIIREFVVATETMVSWRFEKVWKRFNNKFNKLSNVPSGPERITMEELEAIINHYNLDILNKLYSNHHPGDPEPADVNRHALNHGLWLNYANIIYSTRVFLFLDMLHSLINQLTASAEEDDTVDNPS